MLPQGLYDALEGYLRGVEAEGERVRCASEAALRLERETLYRRVLPLHFLLLLSNDAEVERSVRDYAGMALAGAMRGQARSDRSIDLDAPLGRLYTQHLSHLTHFLDPGDTGISPLSHLSSLESSLASSHAQLLAYRSANLALLASFPSPVIPSPPSLADQTNAIRRSTATLSTAHAKLELLSTTASTSHLISKDAVRALRKMHDLHVEARDKLEKEVRRLEGDLEGYQVQLEFLGRPGDTGGYGGILDEWVELRKEEKEIRADLRRLGWKDPRRDV